MRYRNNRDDLETLPARLIVVGVLVAILGGGCFFSPRDPDPPRGPGGGGRLCPTVSTSQEFADDFARALAPFTVEGIDCLFAEDFVFHPSSSDSSELADGGSDVFAKPWDRTKILDVFQLIKVCIDDRAVAGVGWGIELTYPDVLDEEIEETKVRYSGAYNMVLTYFTEESGQVDLVFAGRIVLDVRDEGDSWRLFRWEDGRQPPDESWGRFMGDVEAGIECSD